MDIAEVEKRARIKARSLRIPIRDITNGTTSGAFRAPHKLTLIEFVLHEAAHSITLCMPRMVSYPRLSDLIQKMPPQASNELEINTAAITCLAIFDLLRPSNDEAREIQDSIMASCIKNLRGAMGQCAYEARFKEYADEWSTPVNMQVRELVSWFLQ